MVKKKTKELKIPETQLSKLTIKERNFIKYYIESDGNGLQSAMKAYNTTDYSTAGAIASENLKKPKLYHPILLLMDKMGITDGKLLSKLKEGLDAKKTVGSKDDFIETEDYATRHKYLETGLKLKGHLLRNNETEEESAPANITINFRNQSLILSRAEAEHFPQERSEV